MSDPSQHDPARTLPHVSAPADPDSTVDQTTRHSDSTFGPRAPGAAPVSVPGYEILGELGRGGMGVVYKARDVRLNRTVALKMILGGNRADKLELMRFLAEAEVMAALKHPNVAQVYELGDHDGSPFLAMELLTGGSLAGRLKSGPRLAPRDAAELVARVARGVAAAHAQGVVHRDLKPANVLFDADGEPKVTDFGLAKNTLGADLTRTVAIMGTPAFMAPEQASGNTKFVGPQADVWALGVVLYECLTGDRPFRHRDPDVLLAMIRTEEPQSMRSRSANTPRDLETICAKCLEKEPLRRYATADELADDLQRFLDRRPIAARPVSQLGQLWRWARRNPALAAAFVAVFALAMATAGVAGSFALFYRGVAEKETGLRKEAQDAQKAEADAKKKAEDANEETRSQLYSSEMNEGMRVAGTGGAARLRELAARWRPEPGKRDLRGWEWQLLNAAANAEERVLDPECAVTSVAWTPDGKKLAVGQVGSISFWDPNTGAKTGEWNVRPFGLDVVWCVQWSPDGSKLAAAGGDVVVFDGTTGKELQFFECPDNKPYRSVCWKPGGKIVAFHGFGDDAVHVHEVRTAREVAVLRKDVGGPPLVFGFSPDGSMLATSGAARYPPMGTPGGPDQPIKVWSAETWQQTRSLDGLTVPAAAIAWSRDGKRVAATSEAGETVVWDRESGKRLWKSNDSYVRTALAWSPDGRRLASGGYGNDVRLVEPGTGEELALYAGHTAGVHAVVWSPDGRRLASVGKDNAIRIWDATHAPPVWVRRFPKSTLLNSGATVAWSRDGTRLLGALGGVGSSVWDVRTGELAADSAGLGDGWSHDGRLFVAYQGEVVVAYNRADNAEVARAKIPDRPLRFVWSPREQTLAARSADRLWMWDVGAGKKPVLVSGGDKPNAGQPASPFAWSPDGKWAATAAPTAVGWDVSVWDAGTTNAPRAVFSQRDAVGVLAWSPDGGRLVVAGQEPVVRVLNAATWEVVLSLRGHTADVLSAAWHPDGSRLASTGRDRTMKLWDARTGAMLASVDLGGNGWSVGWNGVGASLAVMSDDGVLRVWDATRGSTPKP